MFFLERHPKVLLPSTIKFGEKNRRYCFNKGKANRERSLISKLEIEKSMSKMIFFFFLAFQNI